MECEKYWTFAKKNRSCFHKMLWPFAQEGGGPLLKNSHLSAYVFEYIDVFFQD